MALRRKPIDITSQSSVEMACRLFGSKLLPKPILLWTGPLQTNFNEIRIMIQDLIQFMKMPLKILSAKLPSFCPGLGDQLRSSTMTLPQTLRWRHNEHDSVSNHQPHHCLLNRLLRADQRKHQSSDSLAFVRGIHRGPLNSPHKWPVTPKMFPFDDVIMLGCALCDICSSGGFMSYWPQMFIIIWKWVTHND